MNSIIAHPRSGSTTLIRAINMVVPDCNCIEEPYGMCKANSIDGFLITLHKLCKSVDVIKHLYSQIVTEWNSFLVDKSRRVVFLYRNDLFQAFYSLQIARKTSIYQLDASENIHTDNLSKHYSNMNLDPFFIDIALIEDQIRRFRSFFGQVVNFCDEIEKPYIVLKYEDLFCDVSLDRKKDILRKVISFLDFQCDMIRLESDELNELLSFKRVTTNAIEPYILNKHEVDEYVSENKNEICLL